MKEAVRRHFIPFYVIFRSFILLFLSSTRKFGCLSLSITCCLSGKKFSSLALSTRTVAALLCIENMHNYLH